MQRRFTKSLTYGLAYTFSKALGTVSGDNNQADPINSRLYDYGRLNFDRRHVLAVNYVYNLPSFSRRLGLSDNSFGGKLTKAVFGNFQVSGISQFRTGAPATPALSLQSINPATGATAAVNLGQRITGSYTLLPSAIPTGNPSGNGARTAQFDYTQFRLPDVGTEGRVSTNYLSNPGTNVTNLSLFKNIPFGGEGSRKVQLRFEFFNVFNHPQFDGFNSALQFVGLNQDFSNYTAIQQASAQTINNTRGGTNKPNAATDRLGRAVGEVNSQPAFVSGNRAVQLAIKVYF